MCLEHSQDSVALHILAHTKLVDGLISFVLQEATSAKTAIL